MNLWTPPEPASHNPLHEAVAKLQARGFFVSLSDIPGLFFVDGRELTIGQMMFLASDPTARL